MANRSEDTHGFHVILTTYGAWLPGDPRGFQTRHHRDHIEGDYKNRPPRETYVRLHNTARANQVYSTVTFTSQIRQVVVHAIHDRLNRFGCTVAVLAVSGRHAQLLTKLPPSQTRHWIGMVKRHVTFLLRERGWSGPVWAGGAKFVPIRDRRQQLNVYRYIAEHEREGAVVWRYCDRVADAEPGDAVAGL